MDSFKAVRNVIHFTQFASNSSITKKFALWVSTNTVETRFSQSPNSQFYRNSPFFMGAIYYINQ